VSQRKLHHLFHMTQTTNSRIRCQLTVRVSILIFVCTSMRDCVFELCRSRCAARVGIFIQAAKPSHGHVSKHRVCDLFREQCMYYTLHCVSHSCMHALAHAPILRMSLACVQTRFSLCHLEKTCPSSRINNARLASLALRGAACANPVTSCP
jgi:hypothetical protein